MTVFWNIVVCFKFADEAISSEDTSVTNYVRGMFWR
jgi:hypothetical protein